MSKQAFTKFVKSLEEEELREELKSLYSKFKDVKAHYAMELGSDDQRKKIFDKAKKDIKNLYYIRNLPRKRPRIQKVKSIIKEVSEISIFTHEKVDLLLFATEVGLEYLLRKPNTTTATFNNCRDNFTKATELISQLSLQEDFGERCGLIVADASHIYMLEEDMQELYDACF